MEYRCGQTVYCPGILDRRRSDRGDRRTEPRPCPANYGRAGKDTVVVIRVKPLGYAQESLEGQMFTCLTCHNTIQVRHLAAREAA